MPANIRLYGTTGYVELAAPATGSNTTLTLPTDSIQPGMVLITSQSFSAVSSVSVNNCFTSTYQNYRILLTISSRSATGYVYMRWRAAGTDTSSATYGYGNARAGRSTTSDGGGSGLTNASTSVYLGYSATGYPFASSIDINSANISSSIINVAQSWGFDAGPLVYNTACVCTQATVHDGVTIYPDTGTITGNIKIYGYRN